MIELSSQAAGLATGTIHPILARLEGLGWLASRWEDIDPATAGRPKRRYYRLSSEGAEHARHALATACTPLTRLLPGLNPGLESAFWQQPRHALRFTRSRRVHQTRA